MRHQETKYNKVFIKNPNCTADMLQKRCQEFIDISDSAQPIIELIETGTTDVSHLINRAKGGQ